MVKELHVPAGAEHFDGSAPCIVVDVDPSGTSALRSLVLRTCDSLIVPNGASFPHLHTVAMSDVRTGADALLQRLPTATGLVDVSLERCGDKGTNQWDLAHVAHGTGTLTVTGFVDVLSISKCILYHTVSLVDISGIFSIHGLVMSSQLRVLVVVDCCPELQKQVHCMYRSRHLRTLVLRDPLPREIACKFAAANIGVDYLL